MKNILLLSFIYFFSLNIQAQEAYFPKLSIHNIYGEYDVNHSFSVHYERIFKTTLGKKIEEGKRHFSFAAHIGLSHSQISTQEDSNPWKYEWYGIPIGMTAILGKNKSHLEAGLNYTFQKWYHKYRGHALDMGQVLSLRIGYRFQDFYHSGVNFSVGLKPSLSYTWINTRTDLAPNAFLYLRIGYDFQ